MQRVFYSIFPGRLRHEKDRKDHRQLFNSLVFHFRPRTVPVDTLKFTLTWGLGGMAAVLILIQFGTGLLLKFAYQPFPDKAYGAILHLQQDILFGQLIRNVHHLSGNMLLFIVFLHFLRAFFTGAFHPPRQFNWIIGLGLFLTVLLSNFTGYLLPWDQLSFWAITICTGMLEYIPGIGLWLQKMIRGGADVGPYTLSNFYTIHTAILPAVFLMLMPFHFWRIRKAGGLVIPRSPKENQHAKNERVPGMPNLILREAVVALVLTACILWGSVFLDAPLADQANPGLSPNPTKAPWYFMGFQEILLHFDPLVALCLIPLFLMMALVGIPYIPYPTDTSGIWFASLNGRRMAIDATVAALVATPVGILLDEYVIDFPAWMPGLPSAVTNGLLKLGIILAGFYGFHTWLKRRYGANRNEVVQTVFVFFLSAFIIMTVTGIWFRGPGMRLAWPWI